MVEEVNMSDLKSNDEVLLTVPDSHGSQVYTDDEVQGIIEAIKGLVIDVENMSVEEITVNMMALEVCHLEEAQCGKFFKEYREVADSIFDILNDNLEKA